jgi:restriction endonuclease S subunit
MQLMAGFKRTEVGVIPADWEVRELSDCSKRITDGEHLTPRRTSSGYFLLSARNIQDGRVDLSDVDFVGTDEYLRIRKRCNPESGDVLISCSGTVGRVATVPHGLKCVMVRSAALVKPDPTRLSGRYAQYFLQSPAGQNQIGASLNQGAQANLFLNHIQSLRVPLPPNRAEQDAIAGALSDTDALIESLEQLIAKKRHIKQGAMQQLLRPKVNWVTRTLSQIADIRSGGTPSTNRAEFWDGDVPWCTPTDITALKGQKYLTATSRTITSQGLKASSAEVIPAHSIVMTSRATIGECAINRVPLATNQGFKNFVPFQGTDAEFLYYLLLTKKQDFIGLCGGSTFLEIGKTQLVRFEVALPAQEAEQTAIATILSDMDAEIAALEAKLTKTRQIKQGMMRELLTGRIRLVDTSAVNVKHAPDVSVAPTKPDPPHNWAFNEAVVIAVLADRFGKPEFPLGRLRYTKLSYLMHRKAENDAQGYLKKAAGPYNPKTRYAGPEKIAEHNGYARPHQNGKFKGFIAAENIDQARSYFARWYGTAINDWLEQFRFQTNDELERLATVDMAMNELQKQGKPVDATAVRTVIESEPEWAPKLTRAVFSDEGIAAAIAQCRVLLAS